jgi:predicted nucleic acid-binding Zn ribbon protein
MTPEHCKECGEPLPDGEIGTCQDCRDFLEEREARAAIAWYDVMEEHRERAN